MNSSSGSGAGRRGIAFTHRGAAVDMRRAAALARGAQAWGMRARSMITSLAHNYPYSELTERIAVESGATFPALGGVVRRGIRDKARGYRRREGRYAGVRITHTAGTGSQNRQLHIVQLQNSTTQRPLALPIRYYLFSRLALRNILVQLYPRKTAQCLPKLL